MCRTSDPIRWTRMHSSRIRTGRSLTVCRSLLPGGGCLLWGVSAPGGVSAPRGWSASVHAGIPHTPPTREQTPPMNRMTNRCKNITLATTSLRPVINRVIKLTVFDLYSRSVHVSLWRKRSKAQEIRHNGTCSLQSTNTLLKFGLRSQPTDIPYERRLKIHH